MRYPILFSKILNVDLRVVAFVTAILIYAAFGAPTPDVLSWVEVFVGLALVFIIGARGFVRALGQDHIGERWIVIGQVFLLYGLVIGVIGGLVADADKAAMIRDVLPFGFMFLPLFLKGFARDQVRMRLLIGSFVALGLLFSLRTSGLILGFDIYLGYEALSYLANSPAVLFAGLFMFGVGLQSLSVGLSAQSLMKAGLCFGLCFIAMMPVVMTAQRASMVAFAVYSVLAFGFLFVKAPRRMMVIGAVLSALVVVFLGGMIGDAYQSIANKSAVMGDNKRVEDVLAVWQLIAGQPMTLLFGQGWGASFASPAVMDIEVNFTHSLLSSMLLKLGMVGLVLCSAYVGVFLLSLVKHINADPIMIMALLAPLLIDVFLYAAFKSLDFGLLLVLISCVTLFQRDAQGIASSPRVLYEKT